jgi:hypothetical protein
MEDECKKIVSHFIQTASRDELIELLLCIDDRYKTVVFKQLMNKYI